MAFPILSGFSVKDRCESGFQIHGKKTQRETRVTYRSGSFSWHKAPVSCTRTIQKPTPNLRIAWPWDKSHNSHVISRWAVTPAGECNQLQAKDAISQIHTGNAVTKDVRSIHCHSNCNTRYQRPTFPTQTSDTQECVDSAQRHFTHSPPDRNSASATRRGTAHDNLSNTAQEPTISTNTSVTEAVVLYFFRRARACTTISQYCQ